MRVAEYAAVAVLTVLLAACASAQEEAPAAATEPVPEIIGEAVVYRVELADRPVKRLPAGARRSGETFGCGDRLVALPVELAIPAATPEEKVAGVLAALLAPVPEAGPEAGLHDALRRSDLRVAEVIPAELAAEDGIYRVRLHGRLRIGGTCDVPRIRQQIEATASQFPEVAGVEVYVGEEPLDKLLSARGQGL